MIDYVIATQGYRSLIQTCEVVREVPCGTHMGVRTNLVPEPASSRVNALRRPQYLEAVVDFFFSKKDFRYAGRPGAQLGASLGESRARPKAHVHANRVDEIDAYVKELGSENDTLVAAIKNAQWSAAPEYRLFASAGIRVDEISFDDLEPFLGRGRMPVLQNILPSDLLDMNKHHLEQAAWSQQQDDSTDATHSS